MMPTKANYHDAAHDVRADALLRQMHAVNKAEGKKPGDWQFAWNFSGPVKASGATLSRLVREGRLERTYVPFRNSRGHALMTGTYYYRKPLPEQKP